MVSAKFKGRVLAILKMAAALLAEYGVSLSKYAISGIMAHKIEITFRVVMKRIAAAAVFFSALFTACTNQEPQQFKAVNEAAYAAKDAQDLQQKINQLNKQFSEDFKRFKRTESLAFSDQSVLDVNNLKTLNLHTVSSTSLKPSKEAYCKMMNAYFNELYRLGHFNLNKLDGVKMNNAPASNLKSKFANADAFYNFVLEEHTTYKQAQLGMGFGCNLRGALTP